MTGSVAESSLPIVSSLSAPDMDSCRLYRSISCTGQTVCTSVADPDPKDPYVFGPPGSAPDQIERGTDTPPDPSMIKQKKIVRKLIPTVL
jgi:hypothetical protein